MPENSLENGGSPKEQKPQEKPKRHIVTSLKREELYSGYLPHPELLKKYNDAFPNGAERIFQLAERQADHRMTIEKIAISGDVGRSNKGLYCGLSVAIVGLLVAAFLGYFGQQVAATIIGSIDLVSLVSVFIYGTINRSIERTKKAKAMAMVKRNAPEAEISSTSDDEEDEEIK